MRVCIVIATIQAVEFEKKRPETVGLYHRVIIDCFEEDGMERILESMGDVLPYEILMMVMFGSVQFDEYGWQDFCFLHPYNMHSLFHDLKEECEHQEQHSHTTTLFLHIEHCSIDAVGKRGVYYSGCCAGVSACIPIP